MACSKPLNFENVMDIMHCPRKLTEFLTDHNLLFSFNGQCSVCVHGRLILRIDNSTRDGFTWRALTGGVVTKFRFGNTVLSLVLSYLCLLLPE